MPDATPARFPNKPCADWALNQYTASGLPLGDHRAPPEQQARVVAYAWAHGNAPAYVSMVIDAAGFELRSSNTSKTARALAAALIEAADLCDAFEAEQALREQQETARINAGPLRAIDIGCGVMAFEDAGEVAA